MRCVVQYPKMLQVHVAVPKGKKLRLMYVWHVRQVKEIILIKKWKRKLKISVKIVVTNTKKTGNVIADVLSRIACIIMTKPNVIKGILLALIVGGVLLAVISGVEKNTGALRPSSGQVKNSVSDLDRLSKITLIDYEGNAKSLGDFSGKMLVVNSWAVWCPFCVKELADFAALQEVFPDKITVIAIDRAESFEKVKGFTDELGISEDMTFLIDREDDFYKAIGGFSMPETVFIDGSGAIVFHKRGPMTLKEMKEAVEKLLNKNKLHENI